MKNFRSAFTMMELIFVIVILGILATVAVPRLAANRDDAEIAKLRSDIASIRGGLSVKRSADMMKGVTTWPTNLEGLSTDKDGKTESDSNSRALFKGVLQTPIYASSGKPGWSKEGDNVYKACIKAGNKQCATFTYYPTSADKTHKAGTFDCDHNDATCRKLAE